MKRNSIFQKSISSFYYILLLTLLLFNLRSKDAISQEIDQIDSDPYIDPYGVKEVLNPVRRTESLQAFMLGLGYGLNPIIILAPALNFSMYWDPLIIGLEFSDSESLGIWTKERKENFGNSRFSSTSQFIKWFFGENFYLMASRENRKVELWNRTYNRTGGRANFDMFVKARMNSLGLGFLRFNDYGFFGIDILRLNFLNRDSVTVVEKWETWSVLSGNRNRLDENIEERSKKWKNIINSPTGFLITVGLYY